MAQQIINILVLGSIYSLFSVGLSLSWGVANILNLAHGAIFVTGATAAFVIGKVIGLPLVIMLPLVMIIGAAIMLLMDVLAFAPITRRAQTSFDRELAVLLASLGVNGILINAAEQETGSAVASIPKSVFAVSNLHIGTVTVSNIQILSVILGIVLTAAIAWWVQKSPQGRALRAVAYDDRISPLFGVNGRLLSRATLAVSGALAAAAGVLLSILLSAFDSSSGSSLMLEAFAVIVLGGIGSVVGTALASFGLAAVETIAFITLGGGAQQAAPFVVILIVLLLRPQGVLGAIKTDRV